MELEPKIVKYNHRKTYPKLNRAKKVCCGIAHYNPFTKANAQSDFFPTSKDMRARSIKPYMFVKFFFFKRL